MSLLARAFPPAAADRPPDRRGAAMGGSGGDGLGPTIRGGSPTAVSTANIIITFIGRRLGTMNRIIYERDDNSRRPVWSAEFDYLWGRPNRSELSPHFWTRAFAMLEGWSECFLWRRRVGTMVVGLDLVHPQHVKVDVDDAGNREFTLYGDRRRRYTADDIVQIMAMTWDGVRGVPPVRAGVTAHRVANLQDRWQTGFLVKGSAPSGVILSPHEWDDEALVEFYEAWQEQHGGAAGVGNVIVIQGGAKYQPVTIPPAEAQLLQARQYSREEVLGFYAPGLPHHMLGWRSNTSNFGTGIEAQGVHLVQHVFNLRLDLVAAVIAETMLPPELAVGWVTDQWLRGDAKTQAEVRAKDRMSGFLTREEGRRQIDLPALPVADDLWTPRNVESRPADGTPPPEPPDDTDDD